MFQQLPSVTPLLGRRSRRPRSLRLSVRRHSHHGRAARFEPLEDRAMLAATVQVSDVSVVEGNAGTTNLVFTVTRTGDAVPFTAEYYTTNDTAAAAATGGTPTFTRHTIDATGEDPQHTIAVDIDSDGDMDALTASHNDHTIAWYENDGSGSFEKHIVSVAPNTPETWTGPVSVAATDLDGETAPKTWLSRTMDRVQVVSATLPSKPTARKTNSLLARDQVFESLDRRRLDEPHRSIWHRREFDSDLGLPDRTDATSRNDSKQNLALGSEWDSLVEILADKGTGHRRSAGWHGRGT